MKTSETLTKISESLVNAHKKITHAYKDKTNPHFKSTYATLESVIDATREHLAENSIVALQLVGVDTLITRLQHTSGEFIETETKLYLKSNDMQQYGSALSYARRYALAAILNISQTDDDGNAAVIPQPKPQAKTNPMLLQKPIEKPVAKDPPKLDMTEKIDPPVTPDNESKIKSFALSLSVDDMKLKSLTIMKYGKPIDFNSLNQQECKSFCEYIKKEISL